jgi:glyoxylase I family protein
MSGVSGIDHVGLTVADIEVSLGFWRDLLGLRVLGRGVVEWEHLDRLTGIEETEIEWVELGFPDGGVIELQQYHRPPGKPVALGEENDPGRSHLSVTVDDLGALLREARATGLRSRSEEPVELLQGSYRGALAAYVLDPDGYGVELIQHPG